MTRRSLFGMLVGTAAGVSLACKKAVSIEEINFDGEEYVVEGSTLYFAKPPQPGDRCEAHYWPQRYRDPRLMGPLGPVEDIPQGRVDGRNRIFKLAHKPTISPFSGKPLVTVTLNDVVLGLLRG